MWVIHQNAITRLYDGSTSLSEIDVIQQMKQLLMHWRIFAHFSCEAFKLSNFPISHCADGNFPWIHKKGFGWHIYSYILIYAYKHEIANYINPLKASILILDEDDDLKGGRHPSYRLTNSNTQMMQLIYHFEAFILSRQCLLLRSFFIIV